MAPSKKTTTASADTKKKGTVAKKGKEVVKKAVATPDPLFPSRPRNYGIGGDIRPRGLDLSRFVKWPKYIRIQRQRSVLYQRLKVPPSINQFTFVLNKNEATTVFTLLNKYRPETPAAKKQRVKEIAAATAAAGGKKPVDTKKPVNEVQYGLKNVTKLIEEKKATLVMIANDVDPIELVMWIPALCRKMNIPYMIVKNKGRLGALVHQKTTSVVCLTTVNKEDESQLALLRNLADEKFNHNADVIRKWGGGAMGLKTQAKLDKRAKAVAIEEAKKEKSLGRA